MFPNSKITGEAVLGNPWRAQQNAPSTSSPYKQSDHKV